MVDSTRLSFSIAIGGTKAVATISIGTRIKVLVGDFFPDHFISLDGATSNEIKDKLSEIK